MSKFVLVAVEDFDDMLEDIEYLEYVEIDYSYLALLRRRYG